MEEIPINPQTGKPVTRFVKAKHRDLTREVTLLRTGATATIKAHNYDPTLHGPVSPGDPGADPTPQPVEDQPSSDAPAPARAKKKRTAKKKAGKKKVSKKATKKGT